MHLGRLPFAAPLLLTLFACGGATPLPASPAPPPPVAAPAAPIAATPPPVPAKQDTSLGELDLAVTGSPECQKKTKEGLLALHSFLYDQAHESFAAALAADPACALAAWGDAMTFDHPIWSERDVAKARAALAHATHEEALTAKERAYLATARALFSVDDRKEAHPAGLAAAAAMHKDYPDDDEVALQHALALLAVYGYDPAHVEEQMEAGAIALAVLQRRPNHPGAAHYTIHAMDSREHAILALPAAETYARIAPAAGHAQHMPSHTFVHLGMWQKVVPSNERAYAASVAWEKAHGHTPSKYDWHSYSWLVAAHLELGQPSQARKLLEDAKALLVEANDDSSDLRAAYASMVTDYVSQTDRWDELEAWLAPVFAQAQGEGTGGEGPVACAAHAPGGGADFRMPAVLFARLGANVARAEAAVRRGDVKAVQERLADVKAVRGQMAAWSKALPPDFAARWDAVAAALSARGRASAEKKPSAARQKEVTLALEKLEALQAAVASAGPAWSRTTRELLGEWLLSSGHPKEALAAFERELAARPNRALSLLGAARAAKAAGDATRSAERYRALAELWRDADRDLPALAEARSGAGLAPGAPAVASGTR